MKRNLNLLDENQSTLKIIWLLAWPTVLEQLLLTAVNFVDTAMVGSLGENATGAIAVVMATINLINGIFAAVAIGFGVPVARAVGAGDSQRAQKLTRQAIIATLIIGAAGTLVGQLLAGPLPHLLKADAAIVEDATTYFRYISGAYIFTLAVNISSNIIRCSGDTRTPLLYNIATNCINVVLNFLLIYPTRIITISPFNLFTVSFKMWGAGMGVGGAALATSLAIAFSAIMLTRVLLKSCAYTSIVDFFKRFKIDKEIWRNMFKLSSPIALERITLSGGQVALTAMVTALDTTALAAHHLAIVAEAITYMPGFGMAVASTTLVSQSIGANKPHLAKRYANYCATGGTIIMSLMGVVLYIFAFELVGVLTTSEAAVQLGGQVLKLEAFVQPFFALSMIVSGILRGAGDTKRPFIFNAIGMFAVRLPLAYILTNYTDLGLMGAWIGMVADLFVRGILSFARLRRSDKWLSNEATAI